MSSESMVEDYLRKTFGNTIETISKEDFEDLNMVLLLSQAYFSQIM